MYETDIYIPVTSFYCGSLAEGGGKESDAIEGMEIATRSKGENCPRHDECHIYFHIQVSKQAVKLPYLLILYGQIKFVLVWFSLCILFSCQ